MKTVKYFLLALLTASSAAWAEWIPVGESDSHMVYINPTTIRRSGDYAKMWRLQDFKGAKTIGKRQFLSVRTQNEYDCKGERMRSIYMIVNAEKLGGGETVYVSDGVPDNWTPIVPGSVGETLWEIACEMYGSNPQEKTEARFDSANKF